VSSLSWKPLNLALVARICRGDAGGLAAVLLFVCGTGVGTSERNSLNPTPPGCIITLLSGFGDHLLPRVHAVKPTAGKKY
jgi:hypothetical protein